MLNGILHLQCEALSQSEKKIKHIIHPNLCSLFIYAVNRFRNVMQWGEGTLSLSVSPNPLFCVLMCKVIGVLIVFESFLEDKGVEVDWSINC